MKIQSVLVSEITGRVEARAIKADGVDRLRRKIERLGFLSNNPVTLYQDEGGYVAIDGNHRVEAARLLALATVPAIVVDKPASELDAIKQARESNEASETVVPTTFVDDAELVWRLTEKNPSTEKPKHTQDEAAKAMGWSVSKTKQYSALKAIDETAWNAVRVTTNQDAVTEDGDGGVTAKVTGVTFTENLLRDILCLRRKQQRELCRGLAAPKDAITKAKFKANAANYKTRNEIATWMLEQLGGVGFRLLSKAMKEAYSGRYDKHWTQPKKGDGKEGDAGPQEPLAKLVESIRDEWQKKHSLVLHHGDFYEGIKSIGDQSIDAIITDPPYNISTKRVYRLANQADWKKDFGDWDNQDEAEFIGNLQTWAREFFRVMKPSASGFMFVGEAYLNVAQAIFDAAGFTIKGTFFWCRSNPGVSVSKADFMPAMDFAIQFVKPGEGSRTFNYPGEPDGYSWFKSGICGGNERLKNQSGETLHPTQKPESVIRHLMDLVTLPGDVVLDAFMGVGTTAAVAKKTGRKFVGFEMDDAYFAAAKHRVEVAK